MANKELELAIRIKGMVDSSLSSAVTEAGNILSGGLRGILKGGASAAISGAKAVGGAAAAVTKAAVNAAIPAAVNGTKQAVEIGQEFEKAMSQVQATMLIDEISEEGAESLALLENAARECGRITAFTATQAAEAENYLALAGYTATEAAQALPVVLNVAGAGAMDLAQASDLVTDSMAALRLEVSQENLTEFADIIAKTASSSNTSVEQLGRAMIKVGGTAAGLKGGTVELAASLGILADSGIKAEQGGIRMRNMLLALQRAKNDAAAGKFNLMGFSAFDRAGELRGVDEMFAHINTAIAAGTMNARAVNTLLTDVFNKTDLAAASAMLAATGTSYESLGDVIDGFMNAYAIEAEMIGEILPHSLGEAGIDLEALAASFDATASEQDYSLALMEDYGVSAEVASVIFNGLSSTIGGAAGQIRTLGTIIDAALLDSEDLSEAGRSLESYGIDLTELAGSFDATADSQQYVSSLMEQYGITANTAAMIFNGLSAATGGTATRFEELSAAISDSAGACEEMYNIQLDNLSGDVDILKSGLSDLGIGVYQDIEPSMRDAAQMATDMVGDLSDAYAEGGLEGMVGAIGDCLSDISTALADAAPGFATAAAGVIGSFVTGIAEHAGDIAVSAAGIVGSLADGVINLIPVLIAAGADLIVNLAQGIVAGIPILAGRAVGIVQAFISAVMTTAPSLIQTGYSFLVSLLSGLAQGLPLAITAGGDAVANLINGVVAWLPAAITTGTTIINNLLNGIADALPGIASAGISVIIQIIGAIVSNLPAIIQAGGMLLRNLAIGIVQSVSTIAAAAWAAIVEFARSVVDHGPDIMASGMAMLGQFAAGIVSNLAGVGAAALAAAGRFVSAIFETDWIAVGKDILGSIGAGIMSAFGALVSTLSDAWTSFTDWFFSSSEEVNQIGDEMAYWGYDNEGNWVDFRTFDPDYAAAAADAQEAGAAAAESFNAGFQQEASYELSDATKAAMAAAAEGGTPSPEAPAAPLMVGGMPAMGAQEQPAALWAQPTGEPAPAPAADYSAYADATIAAAQEAGAALEGLISEADSFSSNYAATLQAGMAGAAESVDTAAIMDSMGLSGMESGDEFMAGLQASFDAQQAAPGTSAVDTSAIQAAAQEAGESSGALLASGLQAELDSFSPDLSAIEMPEITVGAEVAQQAAEAAQQAMAGVEESLGSIDLSGVQADTSAVTAAMEAAGTEGGTTYRDALQAQVAASQITAEDAGVDASAIAEGMGQAGTEGGEALSEGVAEAVQAGTGAVTGAAEQMAAGTNSALDGGWSQMNTSATTAMANLQGICSTGAQTAANAVKTAFEGMTITIPKPQIPVISVSSSSVAVGDQSVSVPQFSVSWNALGGIFDRPTIFSTESGLQGVGESGPEAVLPLNTLWTRMESILSGILRRDGGSSAAGRLLDGLRNIGGGGSGEMALAGAGGETIYFSPTYNLYGSATQEDAERAGRATFDEFKKFMKKYERENRRTKF